MITDIKNLFLKNKDDFLNNIYRNKKILLYYKNNNLNYLIENDNTIEKFVDKNNLNIKEYNIYFLDDFFNIKYESLLVINNYENYIEQTFNVKITNIRFNKLIIIENVKFIIDTGCPQTKFSLFILKHADLWNQNKIIFDENDIEKLNDAYGKNESCMFDHIQISIQINNKDQNIFGFSASRTLNKNLNLHKEELKRKSKEEIKETYKNYYCLFGLDIIKQYDFHIYKDQGVIFCNK